MSWYQIILENPFYELAFILIFATFFWVLWQLLKQPLIVMFIALWLFLWNSWLNIVESEEHIHLFAEIWIVILLFIVWLKIDISIIKSIWKVSTITWLTQVFLTSSIWFFTCVFLWFSYISSFYIATALAFSSTIIIIKLLSDKNEIDSLHWQISIGFLLVQDLVVIIVMIILATFWLWWSWFLLDNIIKIFLSWAFLSFITFVSIKWIIPYISLFMAKSQELLTLFAITWAISLTSLWELIWFSWEVWAFLAWLTLAWTKFKDLIWRKLVSIRDFLLLFFFLDLWISVNIWFMSEQLFIAILLSLLVLIWNPLIVLSIMWFMWYKKRTSFLAGLSVAQISEFSLIFAWLWLSLWHLDEKIVSLITLIAIITIWISTYFIIYSNQIYNFMSNFLSFFERKDKNKDSNYKLKSNQHYNMIIIWLGRFWWELANMLDEHKDVKYLGIDFDPFVVDKFTKKWKHIIYWDLEDSELFDWISLDKVKFVVNTVTNTLYSKLLIKKLRSLSYKWEIYLTAMNENQFKELENIWAKDILIPHHIAARSFYDLFYKKTF